MPAQYRIAWEREYTPAGKSIGFEVYCTYSFIATPARKPFDLFVPSPALPELPSRGELFAGQGLLLSQLDIESCFAAYGGCSVKPPSRGGLAAKQTGGTNARAVSDSMGAGIQISRIIMLLYFCRSCLETFRHVRPPTPLGSPPLEEGYSPGRACF